MTLIGGFRAYSYPFLVGDFVISANEQRRGLKKKVVKLGRNCAIAWTGNVVAAEQVFHSLRERFKGVAVTKKDLENTLTQFNPSDFGSLELQLIGWVIDQGEYCFRWRSDWTQELFYAEPAFGGSGAAIMERMCGPGEMHDAANPNLVDLSLAIDTSLTITTNLMSMEILDHSNLTFGHAYEILYFENGEFHYVDDILYSAAALSVDAQDNITHAEFAPVAYKYRVFGEYSVTERYDQQAGSTEMHVILPIGIHDPDDAKELGRSLISDPYRFPISSKFYGVFLVFLAAGFVSPPVALIQRADVPIESRIVDVENDGLMLNTTRLKWMYDTIRKDMK